jgi:ABC-type Na+ efflux pump permease subunit
LSLLRWWWAWLTFYLLSGLLAAGLGAVFLYSVTSSQDLLQLLLGPLVAAAALIYFRLLGRLAWRMTTKSR